MILIASVRGSGSHFLWRCLSPYELPWLRHATGDEDIVRTHIRGSRMDAIRATNAKIVIPSRKIVDVAKTWKARRYLIENLPRTIEYARSLNGLKVRVDDPDFDALEEYVGFEVNRDKSPVRPKDAVVPAKSVDEYMDILAPLGEYI